MQRKVMFSQNFSSFYRPPSPQKKTFGPQFPYLSIEKLLFSKPKPTFIFFVFSAINNSYEEKSAVFAEFHEFLSSPQFFWGNIFKYLRKKSAIFAENMKKVGVSFQKSPIFAAIWGQIKNYKFVKKKTI